MVCGGNMFGAAFHVVNDSSFQEHDRVSEEEDMGATRGFQAGTFFGLFRQVAFGHIQNESSR